MIGQRLPNFLRLDRDSRAVNFYQECCARPLLLISVGAGQPLPDLKPLIDSRWMLVVLQTVEQPFKLPEIAGADLILADDGQVSAFLSAASEPTALLLDSQFRLLLRTACAELDPLAAGKLLDDALSASVQAPLLVVPRVLSVALCRQLIDAYQSNNEMSGVLRSEGGRAVYVPEPEVKIRREHRLVQGHPLWQEVEQRLRCCLLPEIVWSFNYQVSRFEGVKVVAYDGSEGGYFAPHRDNDGQDTSHRRFAMTLNLNTEQYSGGDLCFPEYGQCVKPDTGSAVVFSCNLAHEARRVSQGVRYALVSFFFSDAEQLQKMDYERRV